MAPDRDEYVSNDLEALQRRLYAFTVGEGYTASEREGQTTMTDKENVYTPWSEEERRAYAAACADVERRNQIPPSAKLRVRQSEHDPGVGPSLTTTCSLQSTTTTVL